MAQQEAERAAKRRKLRSEDTSRDELLVSHTETSFIDNPLHPHNPKITITKFYRINENLSNVNTSDSGRVWDDEMDIDNGMGSGQDDGATTTKKDTLVLTADKEVIPREKLDEPDVNSKESSPARDQSSNAYISEFEPHFPGMIQILLDRHAHRDINTPCTCNRGGLRDCCCLDCGSLAPVCRTCVLEKHQDLPFHGTQEWRSEHFQSVSLQDLGFVLWLGHEGRHCPHADTTNKGTILRVLHTNGVHFHTLRTCHCTPAQATSKFTQLMRADLLPSTVKDPRLAFTFQVMKEFHVHSLISKKSSYDYVRALRRLTNPRMSTVPDYNDQFQRAVRVWRLITTEKRSGHPLEIDKHVHFRPKNSLTMPCLACPFPGFNMAPEWEKTEEDKQYIHKTFKVMDTDFKLGRLIGNANPNDHSRWGARGFFEVKRILQQVLEDAGQLAKEQKSTCSMFNAVLNQNLMKFRNEDETAMLAIVDSRHGCVEPQGVVDLQAGERFINSDWALSRVIENYTKLKSIVVAYDIACQYKINIDKRFEKLRPELLAILKNIDFIIGKMHHEAHVEHCQYDNSASYTPGVGRTDGEEVERLWAELNQLAGILKHMSGGGRHETASDVFNDINWRKVEALVAFMWKKLLDAIKHRRLSKIAFETESKKIEAKNPTILKEWYALDRKTEGSGEDIKSVYRLTTRKLPSCSKIIEDLLQGRISANNHSGHRGRKGKARALSSTLDDTLYITFINDGIDIQQKRIELQASMEDGSVSATKQVKGTKDLADQVTQWKKQQVFVMPTAANRSDTPAQPTETLCLWLPSDFSANERAERGLEDLASIELSIRQGEAYDILEHLRVQVTDINANTKDKIKNAHGHTANTRANAPINAGHAKKRRLMTEYTRIYETMIRLGLDTEASDFKPLNSEEDLYRPRIDTGHELGSGSKPEGWIWSVGVDRTPIDGGLYEDDKVRWFRMRASMERWEEEVCIVEEEFRRYVRGCSALKMAWMHMAEEADRPGNRAFAIRTAALYDGMAQSAKKQICKAHIPWAANEDPEFYCDHRQCSKTPLPSS